MAAEDDDSAAREEAEPDAPTPVVAPRASWPVRALRRLLGATGWSIVGLLALLISLAFHLQLSLAGAVAIEALTAVLGGVIQGSVQIGSIENMGTEKLVARNVIIRDPSGREVIRAEELLVVPDLAALWHGTIRVAHARLRNGRVRLYVSDTGNGVSIADTFMPIESGEEVPNEESGGGPHVIIDGIVLDNVLVTGDVPSYEGLRVENLRATGRVDIEDGEVLVRVFDGRAVMTGPYPGRTSIDRIVGRVDAEMTRGIDFFALAHRGEDHVRARFRLTIPEEDATPEIIIEASVAPVRMATVAEMEVLPGLENLTGTFRGRGRIEGPVDDLRLRADVTSEAGRVRVRGRFAEDEPLEIEGETVGQLRLAQLVPAAPVMDVGGRVRLRLDEETRELHAEVEPVTLAGIAIPAFTMDGHLEEEALRIDALSAPHLGGEIDGSGRVGFDGSIDVAVRARIPDISRDPNMRRLAPEAHGSLSADLHIEADEGLENLRGEGRLGLRRARYGSIRAERLDLQGRVSGRGPAPEIHARGDADGLVIGELTLGHADVSIDGGPAGYEIYAESRDAARGTHLLIRGRARSTEDALTLDAPTLVVDLGDGRPWQGNLGLTLRPESSVTVDPLVLRRGSELIEARGTYRFQGPDDIVVRAGDVDLAGLVPLAPTALAGLTGVIEGQLTVGGDLDRDPRGRLAVSVRDGGIRSLSGVTGRVDLTLGDEGIDADVDLAIADGGRVELHGPIALDPATLARDPALAAERAVLDGLVGRATELDLGLLAQLGLVDQLPVSGRLSTDLAFSGTGAEPGLRDAVLVLDSIGFEGWDPLRAKAHLGLGAGRLVVRHAWVADALGELAQMQADLPFSLDALPGDLAELWAQLHSGAWSASARLAGRRVDEWPRPLRDLVPIEGLRLSASLTADGDERGPRARIAAVGQFVEAASEDACGAELRPIVTVDATLEGSDLTADFRGFVGDASARIQATAYAYLPIDRWVRDGVSGFPPTELTATVRGADLADVPYLCRYGRGPINASITAKDLLTGNSVVGAVIDAPRLQLWEEAGERGEARFGTRYRLHARAGSAPEGDALTACLILGVAGAPATPGATCREAPGPEEGELLARLRVPVAWTAGELLPTYDEAESIASVSDLRGVHVAPLLMFIPGVVAGDAVVRGRVELQGPLDALHLNGEVDLTEGHVQIEGLGQHLHEVRGRVELHGDEVIFPADHPISAEDAGGSAQVHGVVGFEGIVPRSIDLVLSADAFPVRREGMVLATLTGGATVGGRIRDDGITTTIATRDFSVRLPEQTAGSLQSLEAHPDVLVVGSERAGGGEERRTGYPVTIRIDARDPFVVSRNDFTAEIRSDLTAVYDDPVLRVRGEAEILRGTFEIFGKRFELVPGGSLSFHNSAELNPRVNIDARYDIPGRAGAEVTVQVRGTLTQPEITFRSTESSDQAEIIALLVSGGRREAGAAEQEATDQAASFLAGLTAGILTLGLREEFGDIIPLLAIESEGAGGTRVRAGFNADDLIPDFMRDVITGAYIEGFLTASQDTNAAGGSSGTGGVGGGVTLEFSFPYNFLMRGTYVPVDNGSLDLLFEP